LQLLRGERGLKTRRVIERRSRRRHGKLAAQRFERSVRVEPTPIAAAFSSCARRWFNRRPKFRRLLRGAYCTSSTLDYELLNMGYIRAPHNALRRTVPMGRAPHRLKAALLGG
jgi:hypothetical protein